MLRNTLAGLLEPGAMEELAQQLGLNLQQRPQELAPSQWVALAEGLNQGAVPPS
jgi:16S rRNA (adenine1518-N6/adenine1519-N6)-dimethyltransferase